MSTKLIIGHRGYSEIYPENTILSFEQSVLTGAKGIEIDVRKTADGEYVIMHDVTVDRTTNGSGLVSNLSWSYLSSLDAGAWKSSEFANRQDTKIPTLQQVLSNFRARPVYLVIHTYLPLYDILTIIDMIESENMINQCILFADKSTLDDAKNHNPSIKTMNDDLFTHSNYASILQQAVTDGWHSISWNYAFITQPMVSDFHANGKAIHASFLSGNYIDNMQSLIDLNVDYILGNNPLEMMHAFNSNGLMQISPEIHKGNAFVYLNSGESWVECDVKCRQSIWEDVDVYL